jgi:glycosyltransferase involved in cell wall biosynthesis
MFVIPSLTFGGVEKFALEYATALKSAGHVPVVVGIGKDGPLRNVLEERGIEHYALRLRFFIGQDRLSFLRNTWAFYRKTKPIQAEVWMGISYWCNILVGLVGPWANTKKRIWNQQSVDAAVFKGRIEQLAKLGITHYAANGLAPLQHISTRHSILPAKIFRLDNILEKDLWNFAEITLKSKASDVFKVLMVANYFPEKLQSMAIEAVSKIRDVRPDIPLRLDLLGAAPGGYFVELNKALAYDLELYGRVFFHQTNAEKNTLFQQADVGLLATLSEGYSNSIVEYMAYGLPVLASDILANRDALGDAFPAAFFENSVDSLAKAMVTLYEDPDLRFKMGQGNRSRVLARHVFNPEAIWPF